MAGRITRLFTATLGVLLASSVMAQSDTDPILEFNMTFKSDEGLLNYNKGWDLKGSQLFWAGDGEADATRANFLYLGFGFCAYGEFDPIMNFTTACGPLVGEWVEPTNGTTFCYSHIWGYFDIGLKGGENGVRRLDSVTFFTGLTAPKGATMDDVEITTVHLLDKGLYKNTSVFSYSGGDIEPCNVDGSLQFRSGHLEIHTPANTSFMVIRGPRGPSLGSVQYTIYPFPMDNNTFAVNTNGPVSPPYSPLYNQPLDPWQRYVIGAAPVSTHLGNGFNYTSVDFYSYAPKQRSNQKSKSNIGAIAGGVVGGVVGLALLGILLWYCTRRLRPSSRITDEKFQIDEGADESVTPFNATSPSGSLAWTTPMSSPLSPGTEATEATEASHSSFGEKMTRMPTDTSVKGTAAATSDSGSQTPAAMDAARSISNSSRSRPTSKGSAMMLQEEQPRASRQLPRHDEDVGPLEQVAGPESDSEEEDNDELLPPMYDPSWENGRLRVRQSTHGRGRRAVAADAFEQTGIVAGSSRRMSM